MNHTSNGNILFIILIAVALFAALGYSITSSSSVNTANVQTEKESITRGVNHNCETQINTAVTRLQVYNGCDSDEISYEMPDGSYVNASAPSDKSCHIFDKAGAGASPCLYFEKPITWTDNVNTSTSGNILTKTSANGWDGTAKSSLELPQNEDGYVKLTLTNQRNMVGLSYNDGNNHAIYIDFTIYNNFTGALNIIENGSHVMNSDTWVVGDIVEVAREDNKIIYKKNGIPIYESLNSTNKPLIAEGLLYYQNNTITNALVSASFQ